MHSGELARLAGVTVRALRQYHQVGVLAEPERGGNGYPKYNPRLDPPPADSSAWHPAGTDAGPPQ
ncbi:MerR family transcriptional regulator [Nonomuraea angiospora]|uniref:helix-turn-helix domain-containing protein n=1 Tax=Nonomuraea angiospora TaxID=46172 RepID=UPI00344B1806